MRQVTRHYDIELAKCGLKITQYSLLSCLGKLGPVRSVDLARALRVDASTLSRNLRPLIDHGWIAMAEGSDARSHSVALTLTGQAKQHESETRWHVAQARLTSLLGEQRVVSLHALLNEISGVLVEEQAPDSSSN